MVCRAKNQYRLIFKSGDVLTMSMIGDEVEFTTQRYPLTPYCWSSQTDSNGEERMHFADFNWITSTTTPFVYELDKSWGFDGQPIPYFFETNAFPGENPFMFTGLDKVRLHGLSYGRASLKIQVSGNQNDYGVESITEPMQAYNSRQCANRAPEIKVV